MHCVGRSTITALGRIAGRTGGFVDHANVPSSMASAASTFHRVVSVPLSRSLSRNAGALLSSPRSRRVASVPRTAASMAAHTKTVHFVTGNANKLAEVRAILGSSCDASFTLEAKKVDLPELQGEPEDIAAEKAALLAEAAHAVEALGLL